MENQRLRLSIRRWAGKHLTLMRLGVWEKTWLHDKDNLKTKLRLMENDFSAWIIILSCNASYSNYTGANIGNAQSIKHLNAILKAMDFQS